MWVSHESASEALEITPADVEILQNLLQETAAIQFSQPPALHFMPFSSLDDDKLKGMFQKEDLSTQLIDQRKQVQALLQLQCT